jgi:DNA-binding transcriptional MocR family regulator
MLAVSRGTVMAAYSLLRQDGWVHSRRGSGTWIRDGVARGLRPDVEADDAGAPFRRFTAGLMSDRSDVIELGLSIVAAAQGLPEDLLTLDRSDLAVLTAEHGYWPAGMPALRSALAERSTQLGDSCSSRSIVVTGGAQQALATAAAITLRRGDTVVVESPTYPGALDAFTRVGACIVTVAADDGWADVTALRRVLDQTSAAALYLIPTCHNPTGAVMSEARRRAVARLVDEREMYLFEDETLADLAFDGYRPPSISSRATGARTLTIGSLSKSVWGGLRIGWLRACPDIAERAVRAKAAQDLGLSAAGQLLGLRALEALPAIAAMRRTQLQTRAAVLRARLHELLPEWDVPAPLGGLSLWVGMADADTDVFAQHALRRGVSISPGSTHCPDGSGTGRARIAFSRDTEVLLAAAERLRQAWDDYTGRPGVRPRSRARDGRPPQPWS